MISGLLSNSFIVDIPDKYLENLFKNEELSERLSIIYNHRDFTTNILGDNPKLFFDNWTHNAKTHPPKRTKGFAFDDIINFSEKLFTENTKDFNETSHNSRKVISIIDNNLWDKCKWNGFGYLGAENQFGICLAFEKPEYGKKIFEDWIKRFGKTDYENQINISIIKGINKDKPFWYKVVIRPDVDHYNAKPGQHLILQSKIHEMQPTNGKSLNFISDNFNLYGKFYFMPAEQITMGNMKPFPALSIIKKHITIKYAWEIDENDIDRVAITNEDSPYIPSDVKDAPILKYLGKNMRKTSAQKQF